MATIKHNRQASQRSLLPPAEKEHSVFTESINVVTYLGGIPTLTSPLVGQQLVAFFAAALEAAHRIPTHVIAAAVIEAALVDVFRQRSNHTKKMITHQRTHAANSQKSFRSEVEP